MLANCTYINRYRVEDKHLPRTLHSTNKDYALTCIFSFTFGNKLETLGYVMLHVLKRYWFQQMPGQEVRFLYRITLTMKDGMRVYARKKRNQWHNYIRYNSLFIDPNAHC